MQISGFHSFVLIGKGASSEVYSAIQESLKRNVVLKKTKCLANTESFILAQLDHPSLISIYDQFKDQNFNYIIEEKIEGLNLKQLAFLDLKTILKSFQNYADGLHYLHSKGYVHGDLSCENLFIDKNLNAKILDLENTCPLGSLSQSGTNGFQNPESIEGKPLTAHSDIYSLALCLYFALSQEMLFKGNWEDCSSQIRNNQFGVFSEKIPIEIATLIERALRIKEPFEDAEELAEALEILYLKHQHIDNSKTKDSVSELYLKQWLKLLNQSYNQVKYQKDITEMAHLLKLLEETGGSYIEEWTALSKVGQKKKSIKKPLIVLNLVFILLLIFVQFIKKNESKDLNQQMNSDLKILQHDLSHVEKKSNDSLFLDKIWVEFADSLISNTNLIDNKAISLNNSGVFLKSGNHKISGLNEKNDTIYTKEFKLLGDGKILWK